jgi:hypothetical protein
MVTPAEPSSSAAPSAGTGSETPAPASADVGTRDLPQIPHTNVRAFNHHQLKDAIDAAQPSDVTGLSDDWTKLGEQMTTFASSLSATANNSEAKWRGAAGERARAALLALASWSDTTGRGLQSMGTNVAGQSTAADSAQRSMPEKVPEYDPAAYYQRMLNASPFEWPAIAQDAREHYDRYQAAEAQAHAAAETYSLALSQSAATMPAFSPPPTFGGDGGIDDGGVKPPPGGVNPPVGSIPPGGSGGPGPGGGGVPTPPSGGGRSAPEVPAGPGGTTPTPPAGVGPSPTPPVGMIPTPGGPGAPDNPSRPGYPGNRGMAGTGGLRPGVPGGSGGAASGFGPGGGLRGAGPGGSAGPGGPGGPGAGGGLANDGVHGRGSPSPGAASRGGAAGASGYPMGVGPGHREEDKEHRRPSYLVESEDMWGEGTLVAPPVLGEEPPDYYRRNR